MNYWRQVRDGIVEAWGELSLTARVNIVLSGVFVALLIGFVTYTSAQPQYVVLSSDLEPSETSQIIEVLNEQGVPYQLQDDNKTIRIPVEYRSQMQLALADQDLPVGRGIAPGFELFNQSELMTNQWLQDVKFMRAVRGELQRQLNAFDFVEYSYVLIREAEDELFVADQQPSEAAVTLATTRPLTKQEVKAVLNIVSHAGGPNLHPGNITITTTAGEVLHLPAQSDYATIANSKLEYVAELERRQENRIMNTLADMGVRGTVRVSAQVDFDEKEVTDEQVTEGTEVSTYIRSTSTTSSESLPQGAPGARANIPEGLAAPGATSTTEEMNDEVINYAPSSTVTRTKTDPGDVVKYTVALVVEGGYDDVAADEGGDAERTYVGLDETERAKYESIVAGVVGDARETPEISVVDHPFDIGQLAATTVALERLEAQEQRTYLMNLGWSAVQIALILAGFFIVRMLLHRAVYIPTEAEEEEEVGDIPEATREDMRRQDIAAEIARLSTSEPETVVALLRAWLNEDEED